MHDLALSTLKLLAVVEALPRCDVCDGLAMKLGNIVRACDEHAQPHMTDYPYAAALRALLST